MMPFVLAFAASFIRDRLRKNQLVILQSTTFPGTTTGPFREVIEGGGLVAGRDFDLAFAPERVNPGDPASATKAVPRLCWRFPILPVGRMADKLLRCRMIRVSAFRSLFITPMQKRT